MKKNIAILASGNGTNAERLIRYFQQHDQVEIKVVISNRKEAYVLTRAQTLGVPVLYLPKEEWGEEGCILSKLRENQIDFIVLAGFLARINDDVLQAYPDRIVNIHPSLLPKYGGKGMYGDRVHQAVVANGEHETGITIHYINEHYDEGGIIEQHCCEVLPSDDYEEVARKVHALEYEHYPKAVERLLFQMP